MDNYRLQIVNCCRQTWYNLNGEYPSVKEMIEMLGNGFAELIEALFGRELQIA